MADNFNVLDFNPYDVRSGGTVQQRITFDLRSAVGPASYTQGTGIAVDLSASYSSLLAVFVSRAYVTSTKAADTRKWFVHEAGTDLYSSRKFRLLAYVGATPAGTIGAHATDTNMLKATGVVLNVTATETGAAAACGALSCTGNHPNSIVAQRLNIMQGSGLTKVEGVTGSTHSLTGTAETVLAEVPATTNLSTITVEFVVLGVPT